MTHYFYTTIQKLGEGFLSEWNNISGAKTLWGVAVGGRLDNDRAARAGGAVGRLADESEIAKGQNWNFFGRWS